MNRGLTATAGLSDLMGHVDYNNKGEYLKRFVLD